MVLAGTPQPYCSPWVINGNSRVVDGSLQVIGGSSRTEGFTWHQLSPDTLCSTTRSTVILLLLGIVLVLCHQTDSPLLSFVSNSMCYHY